MVTVKDVDEQVYLSLQVLSPTVYKVEREQVGEVVTYSVHKHDALMGKYRIMPRREDGAICFRPTYHADDRELMREWEKIVVVMIWADVQRRFGESARGFEYAGWIEQPAASGAAATNGAASEALQAAQAAQPVNSIADNLAGTVNYWRNEQGQTVINGTVNPGYKAVIGNSIALVPDATPTAASPAGLGGVIREVAKNTTGVVAGPEYDKKSVEELKHKAARFDAMRQDGQSSAAAPPASILQTPYDPPEVKLTGYVTPEGASAATIQPSGMPVWVTPAVTPNITANDARAKADNEEKADNPRVGKVYRNEAGNIEMPPTDPKAPKVDFCRYYYESDRLGEAHGLHATIASVFVMKEEDWRRHYSNWLKELGWTPPKRERQANKG